MGYIVERANIVNRLFYSLQMAARNLPGSMAIAALLTCAVFSTASGIVGAVVTLMDFWYFQLWRVLVIKYLCLELFVWRNFGHITAFNYVNCILCNC